MKRKLKKILSYILTAAILTALLPAVSVPVLATEIPDVQLGAAVFSGGKYFYSSAEVSGSGIKTILISFSGSVTAGDRIVLPAATTGFTVSGSSAGNDYAKRINLDDGVEADAIQDYLRGVGFEIASATQTVEFTVTTDNIEDDTYYNIDTKHYYQYIPDTSSSWMAAYNSAKSMTYMGRTGYLATVMSEEEDTFLNSLSNGKTGWLGGTILEHAGLEGDLYYSGFDTVVSAVYGWYWACGPERGEEFYNTKSLYPNTTASGATSADASNTDTYYNWARGTISYEPNNQTEYQESSHGDYETCLTTLEISGNRGKYDTVFSWNDKRYNTAGTGEWDAKGYFVEYGDELIGDSGAGSAAFASDSGALTQPSAEIRLTTVTWTSPPAYTCDIELPTAARMVTVSVDSGYFTVPSLGGVLAFLGGTSGTSYINDYDFNTQFGSAVFSFTDVSAAEDLLDDIVYTPDGATAQTITATSSSASPIGSDIYFQGHFYRYVENSIDWPAAVLEAADTDDPYFGGRGYIATAATQAENSILLRLVENGADGSDHWDDVWMGGLWQRNGGTVEDPEIARGVDGDEITYADLVGASDAQIENMLVTYTDVYAGFIEGVPATYICNNQEIVRYYWIDGPEAGEELPNNTAAFAPWHATSGVQDEPNRGDFIYTGWEGAYWDDLMAYNAGTSNFVEKDGYILEFSGFGSGSTAEIIKEDTKTVSATQIDSAAITGITAPTAGGTPDTTAVCSTEGISDISVVTWSPIPDTTFGFGVSYTASVTLTADAGYQFAVSPGATVNGHDAVVSSADETQITVEYTFPDTGLIAAPTAALNGDASFPVANTGGTVSPTLNVSGILTGYNEVTWEITETSDPDNILTLPAGTAGTLDNNAALPLGDFTIAANGRGQQVKTATAAITFAGNSDDYEGLPDPITLTFNLAEGPRSSGRSSDPNTSTEKIPVIIDGRNYNLGTAIPETDDETGVQTTVVTVDEEAFNEQLAKASNSIIIPVPEINGSTAQQSVLTAEMVESAAQKEMKIEVQTGDVSYVMRAAAVPVAETAGKLGASADELADIEINITIAEGTDSQAEIVENAEEAGTWTLMLPPIDFTVTATYKGRTVSVDRFEYYIERIIAIPDGVEPEKITTALVVTGDGDDYHVPTDVYQGTDGRWYARIHSLTSSVYALVWNEQSFADARGTWYESIVAEMASRMIVNGRNADTFDGAASITRAEFAAVIVRALGLPETGESDFTDVPVSAWYCGAVGQAYEYAIVNGRGNNCFDPNANITREEAMAMIQRAAVVAEFTGDAGSAAANFPDLSDVSGWAVSAVEFNLNNGLIVGSEGLIRPSDKITRAETATVVLRLLQKAGLVDVRSQT